MFGSTGGFVLPLAYVYLSVFYLSLLYSTIVLKATIWINMGTYVIKVAFVNGLVVDILSFLQPTVFLQAFLPNVMVCGN